MLEKCLVVYGCSKILFTTSTFNNEYETNKNFDRNIFYNCLISSTLQPKVFVGIWLQRFAIFCQIVEINSCEIYHSATTVKSAKRNRKWCCNWQRTADKINNTFQDMLHSPCNHQSLFMFFHSEAAVRRCFSK